MKTRRLRKNHFDVRGSRLKRIARKSGAERELLQTKSLDSLLPAEVPSDLAVDYSNDDLCEILMAPLDPRYSQGSKWRLFRQSLHIRPSEIRQELNRAAGFFLLNREIAQSPSPSRVGASFRKVESRALSLLDVLGATNAPELSDLAEEIRDPLIRFLERQGNSQLLQLERTIAGVLLLQQWAGAIAVSADGEKNQSRARKRGDVALVTFMVDLGTLYKKAFHRKPSGTPDGPYLRFVAACLSRLDIEFGTGPLRQHFERNKILILST